MPSLCRTSLRTLGILTFSEKSAAPRWNIVINYFVSSFRSRTCGIFPGALYVVRSMFTQHLETARKYRDDTFLGLDKIEYEEDFTKGDAPK